MWVQAVLAWGTGRPRAGVGGAALSHAQARLPSTIRAPKAHSPEIVLLILRKIFSKSAKSLQEDWNMCMKRLMNRFSILQTETQRRLCTLWPHLPLPSPSAPWSHGASRGREPRAAPRGQLIGLVETRTETGTHAHALPSAFPLRKRPVACPRQQSTVLSSHSHGLWSVPSFIHSSNFLLPQIDASFQGQSTVISCVAALPSLLDLGG